MTDQLNSAVEQHLDALHTALVGRVTTRELRHLLLEAQEHLYDEFARALSDGLDEQAAGRRAVETFGPVTDVATMEVAAQQPTLRRLLGQSACLLWLLGAVGAISIGVSGAVAWVFRGFGGDSFLASVAPHQVLSASDCARWLGQNPTAKTCASAAITDWAEETIFYRLALGLLGLAALLAYRRARRRIGRYLPGLLLVRDSLAMTTFAAAALATGSLGISAVVSARGDGAGQWLSAAPVALVFAAVFSLRLLLRLRGDVDSPSARAFRS
jgi:hypothetical protein